VKATLKNTKVAPKTYNVEASFIDESNGTSPLKTMIFTNVRSRLELEKKINDLLIESYTDQYISNQTATVSGRKLQKASTTAEEIAKASDSCADEYRKNRDETKVKISNAA
jgi:hypothetical protein